MSASASRRQVVKAAAWAVPVVALAATAPLAAASTPNTPDPDTPIGYCGTFHSQGNNGTYLVFGNRIVVSYHTVPDIYEVNLRLKNGQSLSFGTNYGTAPAPGSLTWVIDFPPGIAWVQVHGFNDHYGEVC